MPIEKNIRDSFRDSCMQAFAKLEESRGLVGPFPDSHLGRNAQTHDERDCGRTAAQSPLVPAPIKLGSSRTWGFLRRTYRAPIPLGP